MRTAFLLFGIIVAVLVGGLVVERSRPVIYAFVENGDPVREPAFSLLNPFRDRSPERPAESILQDFKRGQYARAVAQLDDPTADKDYIAERERQFRLHSWKLMNRTDRANTSKLFYQTSRSNSGSQDSMLWVTVERDANRWKVKSYEAWY